MFLNKINNNYPFIEFPLFKDELIVNMHDIPSILEFNENCITDYFITNYGRIFSFWKK